MSEMCVPLHYESELKPRNNSVTFRTVPKHNPVNLPLVEAPISVNNTPYEEPQETTKSSLDKIRSSVQGIQNFNGRLGAAFAKRSPQVGILNRNKAQPKNFSMVPNKSNSQPKRNISRSPAIRKKRFKL